jgi:lycopene cyclase domain-containing protein
VREYAAAVAATWAGAALVAARARVLRQRSTWVGAAAFAALTVAADNLLIGAGVYGYRDRHRCGLRVGHMPVEDLAYGIALYLVAVSVWSQGDGAV